MAIGAYILLFVWIVRHLVIKDFKSTVYAVNSYFRWAAESMRSKISLTCSSAFIPYMLCMCMVFVFEDIRNVFLEAMAG